ncbi:MAG: Na+/H+ antiporter NhaA [Epsilonproteobacteria bacterium]|nr:Na+/H+ antiporter NhaA [Campylobacterota bacterium]
MGALKSFFSKESSAGVMLIVATILALIFQNSFLDTFYTTFLHTPVEIRFGDFEIAKPLLLWVNDGLMAIFFLLIGIEIKREILEGHLSSLWAITLPTIAAVGGMVVPALIYIYFNRGDSFALNGWAIPTATDIAFALGILSLLGNRVPISLKIFLMALAIIDDLGAIIIIALFYTQELSLLSLIVASLAIAILALLNYFNVTKKGAYFIVGAILWISVLKSGVHATLAGVILGLFIPLRTKRSIAKEIEHTLAPYVNFFILPLFAFVNAGVDLREISIEQLFTPVPLGIMLGLFIGKQLGVFLFSWSAIKLKIAKMPDRATFFQLYGVAILTGIGFTMSLFIDSLAFNDSAIFNYADRLAILIGSFLSAIVGFLVLKMATRS